MKYNCLVMRVVICIVLMLSAFVLIADDHHIDFDRYTDFSTLKTFALREGKVDSSSPELNNTILLTRIADAIRSQLNGKGLKETRNDPAIIVDYRIGAEEFLTQRGGPTAYSEGTLVVDLLERASGTLIWRGVYRDNERNNLKLAQKLPGDVKKFLSEYPPRQKKPIEPRPATLVTTRLSPKAAAAKALEIVKATRLDTAFLGPDAHPGLSISLSGLERTAQAVSADDGAGPAATEGRINAFRKALNDAAQYATSIADRGVETPADRAKSRELASQLRSLQPPPVEFD
jgi:hypothetical protein